MVSRVILIVSMLLAAGCATGPQPAPPLEVEKHTPQPPQPNAGLEDATAQLIAGARKALDKGDLEQAAALLRRAQRLDSRNGAVYLELARLYSMQLKDVEAQAVAERGLLYCRPDVCEKLRGFLN